MIVRYAGRGEQNESIASDYVFVSLKEAEKGVYTGVLPAA